MFHTDKYKKNILMKQKLLILTVLLGLNMLSAIAQQKNATISFDKIVHDFGDIKEADGRVSYQFEFTNTGNNSLIIQKVNASCGCTTPTWTKKPVLAGEKGFVNAVFDPAHRPGRFSKTIHVMTSASNPHITLTIKGNVIPKPLSIEEQYRSAMANVRFKTNHMSFGTVNKGESPVKSIELINTDDVPVELSFKNLPSHINAVFSPKTLEPDQKGEVKITYLSENKNDWDFVIDRIPVYINGKNQSDYRLIVSANIQEDFTALSTEDLEKAPVIEFESKTFTFEKLKQGEKTTHQYKFKNTGKSDLVIRKVRASCGCTAIMTEKKIIKPGEEGNIEVSFNSAGKLGNQNKTVTVISNDPKHPREILWIRGEVIN